MTHPMRSPLRRRFARRLFLALLATGLLLAFAPVGHAAGMPESSLAELVPADAGLYLEINGLSEHTHRFMASQQFQRLSNYPPIHRWWHDNRIQVLAIADEIERRLGARPEDIWHQLFGRRAVFAVWPPEASGQEASALLLVDSSDSSLLTSVVERLVAAQRQAGKWKATRQIQLGADSIAMDVIATEPGQAHLYLATVGELGILATHEQTLRDVLALRASLPQAPEAIGRLPGYKAGMARLAPNAVLRLFINPRPWDEQLLAELAAKPAGSDEARAQRAMVETWQATDYIAMGLEVGERLAVEAFASWNHEELPAQVATVIDSMAGPASLLSQVPADALFVCTGRLDLRSLLQRFGPSPLRPPPAGQTPADATAGVKSETASVPPSTAADQPVPAGWLTLVTVAGGLGPDFVAYLVPRAASRGDAQASGETSPLPADLVVGMHTRPLQPGDSKTLADVMAPMLRGTLDLLVATANARAGGTAARVVVSQSYGVELTSVTGLIPAEGRLRPWAAQLNATYAVVDGSFWAATAPDAVARALSSSPQQSLAQRPGFIEQLGPRLSDPSHLLYMDLAALGQLLAGRPQIIDLLARLQGLDRKTAERSATELASLAGLADSVLAAVKLDSKGAAAAISLSTR